MDNIYDMGDRVYHVTPDSPVGVILDVIYYKSLNTYYYTVAWNHSDSTNCIEYELSYTQSFS